MFLISQEAEIMVSAREFLSLQSTWYTKLLWDPNTTENGSCKIYLTLHCQLKS